ncbi:type II toxin-antitoxin system PemK/MazF family toxin [Streptomyces luteoverticillatus]|uniref:Type II toxin-antitoxin system PemK/MazF family toxin n=1 Tax=Streptomyces luteoverticillatus TaxID=66425 RepID=A0A3Q9FYT5_STRLT|nr:type II toxin-antitoxin system PemK/MazF family toxin [Streptomyces luteoverticillatus]AZQ71616.1 type II toxin-antitoxin system PemK/MazF family toxin [Streptomyces luteoverticillatus]
MKRGTVWELPFADTTRTVLVLSIDEANDSYRAAVCLLLHPAGAYPDTLLSVPIADPVRAVAVPVNLTQYAAHRFEQAKQLGQVSADTMARIERAVRSVLDL